MSNLDEGVKAAAQKSLPLPVELGETPRTAHQRLLPKLVDATTHVEDKVRELRGIVYSTNRFDVADTLFHPAQKYLDDVLSGAPLPDEKSGIRGMFSVDEHHDAVSGRAKVVKFAEAYNEKVRKVWPEAPPEILAATPKEPGNHIKAYEYGKTGDTEKNLLSAKFVAPLEKDVLALEAAVLGVVFPDASDVASRTARLFDPSADPEVILPQLTQEAEVLMKDLMVLSELGPDQKKMEVVARSETTHSNVDESMHASHESGFLRRPLDVVGGATRTTSGSSVTSQSVLRTIKGKQQATFGSNAHVSQQRGVHSKLDGAIFVARLEQFQQVLGASKFHDKDHPLTKELTELAKDISFQVAAGYGSVNVPLDDVRQGILSLENSLPLPKRFIDQVKEELASGPPSAESGFGLESLNDL